MKSDVWTYFVQTSDLTVKALMISNSLYHRNFQTKTDMKVKICFHAKFCTQKQDFSLKNAKSQTTKDFRFAPLILKRWIACTIGVSLCLRELNALKILKCCCNNNQFFMNILRNYFNMSIYSQLDT